MIPFNKPYLSGKELEYISEAVNSGKLSGNGTFSKKCHSFFETNYGFRKCLLTTSCTDALEMAAILLDIKEGDEVIMPSYTFVSTANAFILRGAKIIFADSESEHPNMDAEKLEALITPQTKAIIVVHYAGMACNMEKILSLAQRFNLFVVEDAAQAIDSFYTFSDGSRKPLGGIGHLSAFSFHETKNIISGEGGMLVINDPAFAERAEIIWEKGTNRSSFFRGEVDKYGWVDIGSSFLPSEIVAAFLYAQLENLEDIQAKRSKIWRQYFEELQDAAEQRGIKLPVIPSYSTNNSHMFYIVFPNEKQRSNTIAFLKQHGVLSVFHYLSLHKSPFYEKHYTGETLVNSDRFSETLLRLPLYYELETDQISFITQKIIESFDLK